MVAAWAAWVDSNGKRRLRRPEGSHFRKFEKPGRETCPAFFGMVCIGFAKDRLVNRSSKNDLLPCRNAGINMIPDEPHEHPITNELDLHTFRPSEIGKLLHEYFRECRRRGFFEVRVIHGKGSGTLREGVHRLLERLPEVASFQYPASGATGAWGATWVFLTPSPADPEPDGG